MARKTKWIDASEPDDPVDVVARRALESRLDAVEHYLALAADRDHTPEDIHQLRVSTRRAMAALDIFAALLPPRRARKMNKRLKRIRRAAGDSRDLDVLAARLKKNPLADDSGRRAKLQKLIAHLRSAAQPAIEKIHKHLDERDRFSRRAAALVSRVRLRAVDGSAELHTFSAAARQCLQPVIERFFAAAAADLSQPEALHALRISGKQVRYAIEIFAGAFQPEIREEIYPLVEQMQEKLGKVIDHVTAARLYGEWLTGVDDAEIAEYLRTLAASEQAAVELARHDFLTWWTADRAADLQRRFDEQFASQRYEQSA
ncbi:MAG TPA: CHAD domain-containing protein [Pirellulales bacterium]|nr:CHAD domain-containing protein [Pirellulales bacterium]